MQIKNLTRSQYYKQNKLPLISLTHKLKPELPVMTHLLQVMPRLATEIQKLESEKGTENKINLELANAMKIINELEDELEIATSRCNDYQDEILSHENNIRELERKVRKNEETIISLQNSLQKNEFSAKSKLEYQKECFNSILNQYERKYEEMNEAYEQLKFDRQRELLRVKNFHEDSIFQMNMRARQYENTAQLDMKKLQKEIEKGILLNTDLRQKIADLETLNQGQIRHFQRTNAQLSLTNLKLKSQHDHIINSQNTQLGLSQSKIKELEDMISLLERQLKKQKSSWQEEKRILENRCFQSEKNEKISLNENLKQMERVQQELNRKAVLLAEMEIQESSLKYKVSRLSKTVANLIQQKQRMAEDHESMKRQITEALTLDYHMKMDQIKMQSDRLMNQQIQKAVSNERVQLQNYYTTQILKYMDLNRRLEMDQNKYLQTVMIAEDSNKKLQANVIAFKNEVRQLANQKREITEKLQSQIKQMKQEFEGRLKKEQQKLQKEIWQMQSDRSVEEFRLKQSYDLVIKQLNGVIEFKRTLISELKGKLNQLQSQHAFQKDKLQLKIQCLEANFARTKWLNERMARENYDTQLGVENYSMRWSSQKIIQHKVQFEKDLQEKEKFALRKQNLIMAKEFAEYRQKAETEISELQKNQKERILNFQQLEQQFNFLSTKLQETEQLLSKTIQEKARESQKLCLLKEQLHQIEAILMNEKETFIQHISQLQITKNNLENLLLLANQKLHNFSQEHQKLLNEKNLEIQSFRNTQKVQSAEPLLTEKEVENQEKVQAEINEKSSTNLEAEPSPQLEQKFSQKIRKLEEETGYIVDEKLIIQNTLGKFNEETEQKIIAVRNELAIHYQNQMRLKEQEIHELKSQCLKARQLQQGINRKQKWFNDEKQRLVSDLLQKDEENSCLRIQLESLIKKFEMKNKQKQHLDAKWKAIFEKFRLHLENQRRVVAEEIEQDSFERVSRHLESEKIHRTQKSDRSWKSGKISYSIVKNSSKTHSKETNENQNENTSRIDQRCSFNCQNNNDKLQKSLNMIASELYSVNPDSAIKKHVVRLKNNYEEREFQENKSILSNQEKHCQI